MLAYSLLLGLTGSQNARAASPPAVSCSRAAAPVAWKWKACDETGAEVRPRGGRGAAEVRPRCGRGADAREAERAVVSILESAEKEGVGEGRGLRRGESSRECGTLECGTLLRCGGWVAAGWVEAGWVAAGWVEAALGGGARAQRRAAHQALSVLRGSST